jgi:hypothetical protein
MADIYLVPLIMTAKRHNIDIKSVFADLDEIDSALNKLPEFMSA